jgi:tRNA pseudouridine32 synthase/23S rRNA pseudouridine746 synthase
MAGLPVGQRLGHALMPVLPLPAVLAADSWLAVVDKPSGMPSVPARTAADPPSVIERLAGDLGRLEPVHRLDRDTSGLLVLARHREARIRLGRFFENGRVLKCYLAVCRGWPDGSAGEIHLPLAADPDRPPRHRVDPILGRRSLTRWRLLARSCEDVRQSLIELQPVTGRSHQLRVHLAWKGLPIEGDPLYGPSRPLAWPRLALHAARLIIPHPATEEPLVLSSGDMSFADAATQAVRAAATAWLRDQQPGGVAFIADARTRDQ